jgi:8-oxo-dGTP pyrophosphatase MutT (NUDIX family)
VTIAPVRPASTVVLLRRSPGGFEVFLVRRSDTIAFMGGAHVFPGGRVEPHDRLDDAERWCDAVSHAIARGAAEGEAEAVARHVAAVRELFEEAGVLLARQGRGGGIVAIHGDAREKFEQYRRRLIAGEITLLDIAARERLRFALDALVLFANWVTPETETRRFDTWFFLALAHASQDASHHDHEASEGIWITPAAATERCLDGDLALPPPTWTTLRALAQFSDVDDAWTWASSRQLPRVEPRVNELPDGTREILLPGDPRYPPVPGFTARETRFVLKDGRWIPS